MSTFDLSSPEYVANPYPVYQRLQQEAPVYFCPERKFYYVSRYQDVQKIFRHPAASSNRVKPMASSMPEPVQAFAEPLISCLERWLLFLDAPEHTRIRRVVNAAFSKKVVTDLKPRIQEIAGKLVSEIAQQDSTDLIASLAYALPVIVIAEMLGCPESDRDLLKGWSNQIATFLGDKTTLESAGNARSAIIEARYYFAERIRAQCANPQINLLNNLILFQKDNPDFSDDHLIANCIALIFAGHETTTNLIGNTLYTLLQHPHLIGDCKDDDFLASCIEETLRFESPVQRIGRFSQAEIQIGDTIIPPNSRILLMIGAANRDRTMFDAPDIFNPTRKDQNHIAFGYGHHFCSGAEIARQEARIALHDLLNKVRLSLVDDKEPSWHQNLGLRALQTLSVIIS